MTRRSWRRKPAPQELFEEPQLPDDLLAHDLPAGGNLPSGHFAAEDAHELGLELALLCLHSLSLPVPCRPLAWRSRSLWFSLNHKLLDWLVRFSECCHYQGCPCGCTGRPEERQ